MIKPSEIEEKQFSRAIRGYNAEEVDDFLDLIIEDLEKLQADYDKLQRENEELRTENEQHKKSQVSVMNTLDSAKKLMKDISESAEKRADIIIRNARLDAEMIVKDAKDSVSRYSGEGIDLRDRVSYYRSRYKQLLLDEIAHLDDKGSDILSDLEREFFMPSSMDEQIPDEEAVDGISSVSASAESSEAARIASFDDIEEAVNGADEPADTAIPEHVGTRLGVPKETVTINRGDIDKMVENAKSSASAKK